MPAPNIRGASEIGSGFHFQRKSVGSGTISGLDFAGDNGMRVHINVTYSRMKRYKRKNWEKNVTYDPYGNGGVKADKLMYRVRERAKDESISLEKALKEIVSEDLKDHRDTVDELGSVRDVEITAWKPRDWSQGVSTFEIYGDHRQ